MRKLMIEEVESLSSNSLLSRLLRVVSMTVVTTETAIHPFPFFPSPNFYWQFLLCPISPLCIPSVCNAAAQTRLI